MVHAHLFGLLKLIFNMAVVDEKYPHRDDIEQWSWEGWIEEWDICIRTEIEYETKRV